jgi:hypothetical protein
VNSFIAHRSLCAPEHFRSWSRLQLPCRIRRSLGGIAARLPQTPGNAAALVVKPPPCGRGHTRACVIEKNLAWSELGQHRCLNYDANPAQGLQRSWGAQAPKRAGKAVRRGTLDAKTEFLV